MDLQEIKKITNVARRSGVKALKVNGLEIEFKDEIILTRDRKPKLVGKPAEPDKTIPAPPPLPTLDDINRFIYEDTEAV